MSHAPAIQKNENRYGELRRLRKGKRTPWQFYKRQEITAKAVHQKMKADFQNELSTIH